MMGLGMGVGLLLLLLLSAALIAGGVGLAGALFKPGRGSPEAATEGNPDTREILNRRYARGEISREEYQRIRADLDL